MLIEFRFDKFSFTGIVGTKDYRKPEWVTHMEELQEALKGKKPHQPACMLHESVSTNISIDSLEQSSWDVRLNRSKNNSAAFHFNTASAHSSKQNVESFFVNNYLSKGTSVTSVQSEPLHKLKQKQGFVQSAMDDYLNSHRHSLSSVMELIGISERGTQMDACTYSSIESKVDKVLESKEIGDLTYFSEEDLENDDKPVNYYFTLSPIEENSEPSTGSSTLKENMIKEAHSSQLFSSSCDPIPSARFDVIDEKFQTFPRSKTAIEKYAQMSDYAMTMYPLEPRELDPCAFNQLHTVDSQEELQEFLLLESECMSDNKGRGLATAFTDSNECLEDEHH